MTPTNRRNVGEHSENSGLKDEIVDRFNFFEEVVGGTKLDK